MIQRWVTVTARPPATTVPPSSFHRSFIWGHSPSCLLPSHRRFHSVSLPLHFHSALLVLVLLSLHPTLFFLFCFFTSFFPSHSSSLHLTRHATRLTLTRGENKPLTSELTKPSFAKEMKCKKTNTRSTSSSSSFSSFVLKNTAVGVKFSWSFSCSPAVRRLLKKAEFTLYDDISEHECGQAESIAAAHVKVALGGQVNEQQSASHQS